MNDYESQIEEINESLIKKRSKIDVYRKNIQNAILENLENQFDLLVNENITLNSAKITSDDNLDNLRKLKTDLSILKTKIMDEVRNGLFNDITSEKDVLEILKEKDYIPQAYSLNQQIGNEIFTLLNRSEKCFKVAGLKFKSSVNALGSSVILGNSLSNLISTLESEIIKLSKDLKNLNQIRKSQEEAKAKSRWEEL